MEMQIKIRKLANNDIKVNVASEVYLANGGFNQHLVLTPTDITDITDRIELRRQIASAIGERIEWCERKMGLYGEEPYVKPTESGYEVYNEVYHISGKNFNLVVAQARAYAKHQIDELKKLEKIWKKAFDKVVADDFELVDF